MSVFNLLFLSPEEDIQNDTGIPDLEIKKQSKKHYFSKTNLFSSLKLPCSKESTSWSHKILVPHNASKKLIEVKII